MGYDIIREYISKFDGRAVSLIKRDDGLFCFVEEILRKIEDEDGSPYSYEYWSVTVESGLYQSYDDALKDALARVHWLSSEVQADG